MAHWGEMQCAVYQNKRDYAQVSPQQRFYFLPRGLGNTYASYLRIIKIASLLASNRLALSPSNTKLAYSKLY